MRGLGQLGKLGGRLRKIRPPKFKPKLKRPAFKLKKPNLKLKKPNLKLKKPNLKLKKPNLKLRKPKLKTVAGLAFAGGAIYKAVDNNQKKGECKETCVPPGWTSETSDHYGATAEGQPTCKRFVSEVERLMKSEVQCDTYCEQECEEKYPTSAGGVVGSTVRSGVQVAGEAVESAGVGEFASDFISAVVPGWLKMLIALVVVWKVMTLFAPRR
jgi:hypothetical protein